MRKAIFLMGPTAIGKTALACQLYDRFPLRLISVDSSLMYQGLNIGTAKPTPSELARYPHAFIDVLSPSASFSVGDFLEQAKQEAEKAFAEGKIPLFVGGTMLYFKALRDGLAVFPSIEKSVRFALEEERTSKGLPALYARLQSVDPQTAMRLYPEDTQRIVRALEIYTQTGQTMSSYLSSKERLPGLEVPIKTCVLVPQERAWLHARIEARLQKMFQEGFVEEVRMLIKTVPLGAQSLKSVGYRPVLAYVSGTITKEEMFLSALAATRQLAKRQLTWIRHWGNTIEWSVPEEELVEKAAYLLMREIRVE